MKPQTYKQIAAVLFGLLVAKNLVWLINALPLDGEPADEQALSSLILLAGIAFGMIGWDRSTRKARAGS